MFYYWTIIYHSNYWYITNKIPYRLAVSVFSWELFCFFNGFWWILIRLQPAIVASFPQMPSLSCLQLLYTMPSPALLSASPRYRYLLCYVTADSVPTLATLRLGKRQGEFPGLLQLPLQLHHWSDSLHLHTASVERLPYALLRQLIIVGVLEF